MSSRTVAIVGRPNTGKSRLFNRLARKRISIVHDQPGITRDVIATEIEDGAYTLLDTGGLGLTGSQTPAEITAASESQAGFAIDAADLILFVVDGLDGITALDSRIANRLRTGGKKVILVVNKADFGDEKADHEGVSRLGLGEPVGATGKPFLEGPGLTQEPVEFRPADRIGQCRPPEGLGREPVIGLLVPGLAHRRRRGRVGHLPVIKRRLSRFRDQAFVVAGVRHYDAVGRKPGGSRRPPLVMGAGDGIST